MIHLVFFCKGRTISFDGPSQAEANLGNKHHRYPYRTPQPKAFKAEELAEWKGGPKTPHRSHLRSLTKRKANGI